MLQKCGRGPRGMALAPQRDRWEPAMSWDPIKEPGSLTDRIVDRIGRLIDEEGLDAGERLPAEREMARMLGVGRPAVREAVKVLEARGRLVVRHGQGVFVARSAVDEVRDRLANLEVSLHELFEMRLVLEEPAAAWAAQRATTDDVAELAEALAAEEAARRPLSTSRPCGSSTPRSMVASSGSPRTGSSSRRWTCSSR